MSGFHARSTVEEAWSWLDSAVGSFVIEEETVPLTQAYGRSLVQGIVSEIDVPGFDRSAMDGYAVIADETTGANPYCPLRLRVVGESLPGTPFAGTLQRKQAIRIMTGAPIPDGATAVVPVEYASVEGEEVVIETTVGPGKHLGRRGEDIAADAIAVSAGRLLRPQDVAVIASLGQSEVIVRRQPRVRIIITGNELISPGQQKSPYQIYEANSSILLGTVPRDGGVVESLRFLTDDETAIADALLAPGAEMILVSGGSSVGTQDYAPVLVDRFGELAIHGIAMRPSSPTGLGRIGNAIVVLLPGNPVSCLCAYDFFAGRAIRELAGRDRDWPFRAVNATLEKKIASAIGRVDYCRVKVTGTTATPLAISGASILSSTTRADGFVLISAESEGLAAGSEVRVLMYST